MDQDHRLLLKSAKPLLQSRNAAVVMSTAQLFYHCAPRPEIQVVAKAMIRLLRSHTEVQCLVLNCIASMTSGQSRNSSMFEPHLRNFFIRSGSDPTHVKILKLEILTNLATPGNIGIILREFQSYITGKFLRKVLRCPKNLLTNIFVSILFLKNLSYASYLNC